MVRHCEIIVSIGVILGLIILASILVPILHSRSKEDDLTTTEKPWTKTTSKSTVTTTITITTTTITITTTTTTITTATTTTFQENACQCGLKMNTKIVNGQEAEVNSIPWQVGISHLGFFPFCGGTIIGPETILTAAHCLHDPTGDINPSAFQVIVNEHDLTIETESDTQYYDVK